MRVFHEITAHMLRWGKTIQAISETGLSFSMDFHNKERYEQLRQIALEILATINADLEFDAEFADEMKHALQNEHLNGVSGYVTPKVGVAATVFDDLGRILLVKTNNVHKWSLPGGWADEQWTPKENAEREVREETGLVVHAIALLGVFDSRYHRFGNAITSYSLLFECRILEGDLMPLFDEVNDVGFFAGDNLPLLIDGSLEQVRVSFDFYNNQYFRPFFDK